MTTIKLFPVVGITTVDGETKVRFTLDRIRRMKLWLKHGATRADFIDLPEPMTKMDALNFMLTHPEFESRYDQATIHDAIEDRKSRSQYKVKVDKTGSTVAENTQEVA